MAEEIKKIINIDVSKGITNIDSLKKSVKEAGGEFNNFQKGLDGSVPSIKKFNTALKGLALNPVGAAIAAIAVAVKAVSDAMHGSESQMMKYKENTAGLKVITDGFKNVLSSVAEWVVNVSGKVNDFIVNVLGKINPKLKEQADQYKAEAAEVNAILLDRRRIEEENSQRQLEISELRAKMSQTDVYNEKQRLEFGKRVQQLMLETANANKEIAQRNLEALEAEAKHTQNSSEMNEKLKNAKIAVNNATIEYYNAVKRVNGEVGRLNTAVGKHTEQLKEENILLKIQKELYDEIVANIDKIGEDGSTDKAPDFYNVDYDASQREFLANLYIEDERDLQDRLFEIRKEALERKLELDREALDSSNLTEEEYNEVFRRWSENSIALTNLVLANNQRVKKQEEADAEDAKEREENLKNFKISVYRQYASAVGNVFNALAGMQEEGSETQKQYAIMGATINTLGSMVGAIYSIWTDKTIPSAILKGVLTASTTASILATGISQINQMRSTKRGSGLNSGGMVNMPNMSITPLLNEEQDIQRLQTINVGGTQQSDTRVYVLESDITNAQNRVKTKVNNNTF